MKSLWMVLISVLLTGCVSDPVLTGKPQHWKGKSASDLKAAWGAPTRIIPESNGTEVWEYHKATDMIIPKGENMRLGFGGLGGQFGGSGAFSMEKRPEDRPAREEQVFRFKVRDGKITRWYAARILDGRIVWEDH